MTNESLRGDPLGAQPADVPVLLRPIAEYNHKVRSILFGDETDEQRQLRIEMLGHDLQSGLMKKIEDKRARIDKLKLLTEEQRRKLSSTLSMSEINTYVDKLILQEETALIELNAIKLQIVRKYHTTDRHAERIFAPTAQSGYTCVPLSLHEVCSRILGADWPFKTMDETQSSFSAFCNGDWTNPSMIANFISDCSRKGIPIAARSCSEPMTLMAGLKADGMAIAKHQDWAHVYIIEDFAKQADDIGFVIGNTLGGSVRRGVSLTEVDRTFLKPTEHHAVTIIIPTRQ